ncbi:hypothetical protein [Saccharopolyspora rosea]|uniref:hypothetical protein n=1 Tax=Saccharopolyspora rosea TaxID=524884 RepID=UPI0021D7D4C2|nr:hypothetical protein [Saccharopolyspora rosea]
MRHSDDGMRGAPPRWSRAPGRETTAHHVRDFYAHLLVQRVFARDPDGWLLKAPLPVLVRDPDARLRGCAAGADVDEAVIALRRIVETDGGDRVRFRHVSTARTEEDPASCGVRFSVTVGSAGVTVVDVVLVTGPRPVGEPVRRPLPRMPGAGVESVWARRWPAEDHVAEQICALHRTGSQTRQVEALVALLVIALTETVDGRRARQALRAEYARNVTAGAEIELPPRFREPGGAWQEHYRARAAEVPELAAHGTPRAACELADAFLSPLLGSLLPDVWDPGALTWC